MTLFFFFFFRRRSHTNTQERESFVFFFDDKRRESESRRLSSVSTTVFFRPTAEFLLFKVDPLPLTPAIKKKLIIISDFEKSNRSLAYLLNSLPKREAVDAPPPSLSPSPLERFLLSKRQSAGRRQRERQREQERGRALLLFRQKRATILATKCHDGRKKRALCVRIRGLFFFQGVWNHFHIQRNPLFLFFDWTTTKERRRRRRRRRGFFLHFFRCDAFVFLCYLLVEGFLSFLVLQSSSLKKKNKKKRMKKREEFFWDHFLLKKNQNNNTTNALFSNSEPPCTTRI